MQLFQDFAGQAAKIEPLLEKRGLTPGGGGGALPQTPADKD